MKNASLTAEQPNGKREGIDPFDTGQMAQEERDPIRSMGSGCLAAPVGFALSALLLIPLWWVYPFSTADSSAMGPTFTSFLLGVAYALAFGTAAARGLPKHWLAAGLCTLLGLVIGLAVAAAFREGMYEGCLKGTGPQPGWCYETDPAFLRPMAPLYSTAFALLGLALWAAGALRLGFKRTHSTPTDPERE